MSNELENAPDSVTAGISALRGTLAALRDQHLAWERDVAALFDEFDALAVKWTLDSSVGDRKAAQSAVDDCRLELAQQSESLERHQKTTAQEFMAMREMIEQQTELLAAFIGAVGLPSGTGAGTPYDPLTSAVQAEFAQLHKPSSASGAGRSVPVQSS
jgi:hypothetical protein